MRIGHIEFLQAIEVSRPGECTREQVVSIPLSLCSHTLDGENPIQPLEQLLCGVNLRDLFKRRFTP